MSYDGSVKFDTKIDTTGLKRDAKTLTSTFASIRDVMMGPIAAGKMIIDVFKKIGQVADQLENAWAAQEEAIALLDATLKSTGADAWTSSKRLQEMASSLQQVTKFGDETITSMQTVLLGFRNITGENFEKATVEILNMATVMKMDLTSAAQAVGKALDNPAQGMDSLSRQGFKFTQQEKEMMKAMQDAGDLAGAQKIILDELAKTYGGAAEAAGATGSAMKVKLQNAIGDLNEELGRAITESGPVSNFRKNVAAIAAEWANVLKASNDYKEWLKKQKSGIDTTETENIDALTYKLEKLRKDRETALKLRGGEKVVALIDEDIAGVEKQIELEDKLREKKAARAAAEKAGSEAALLDAKIAEEKAQRDIDLSNARIKAYEEQSAAVARLKYEYEKGIITEEEFLTGQLEAAEKLAQDFVDIKMTFGDAFGPDNVKLHLEPAIELVDELSAAIDKARKNLGYIESGLGGKKASQYKAGRDVGDAGTGNRSRAHGIGASMEYTIDATKEEISLIGTLTGYLDNMFDEAKRDAKDWTDVLNQAQSALDMIVVSGLEEIGKELATGEGSWSDWGTVALRALAQVLESIGYQLAALSVTHALMLDVVGSIAAAAGSVAAFVAAGAIKAWADDLEEAGDSIGYVDGQLDKLEKDLNAFEKSLAEIGSDVGEMFVDNLVKGLSGEDLKYELEEYIRKAIIQSIVYTSSMQEQLAGIGAQIQAAIVSGSTDYSSIISQIPALYNQMESAALTAENILNDAFYGPSQTSALSQGVSLSGDASRSMTTNVNVTGTTSIVLDGEVLARVVTNQQEKVYSNAYGA